VGSPPALDANVRKDAKGNPIDIGAYISVVASWQRIVNEAAIRIYPTQGYYNTSGEALYAGLIASLSPEIGTTNQIVPGAPLRKLSPAQVNTLNAARFVTFWNQPQGYVVSSGMTGAYNISQYYRSDFVRLTTVRITQEAIAAIRLVTNPFLGQPGNGPQRAAMENAIDVGLKKMKTRGALQDYRFKVISSPTMRVLGEVVVEVTLIPAFETTSITVRVGLAAS
jgi:hypothetical protein